MEEAEHVIDILESFKEALNENDSLKLKELSNQTLHSASVIQDPGSIALAVIVYTFSKLIERSDTKKVKHWGRFIRKINALIDLSIESMDKEDEESYIAYLERIRKSLDSLSINFHAYIQEVLRKAAINKASKIYEHGISMGQTAKLLGISQWELSEYAGQRMIDLKDYENPNGVKRRAKLALEFFS